MYGNRGSSLRISWSSSADSTSKMLMFEYRPTMRQSSRHLPDRCSSWRRAVLRIGQAVAVPGHPLRQARDHLPRRRHALRHPDLATPFRRHALVGGYPRSLVHPPERGVHHARLAHHHGVHHLDGHRCNQQNVLTPLPVPPESTALLRLHVGRVRRAGLPLYAESTTNSAPDETRNCDP